jgi:hypothetical protein
MLILKRKWSENIPGEARRSEKIVPLFFFFEHAKTKRNGSRFASFRFKVIQRLCETSAPYFRACAFSYFNHNIHGSFALIVWSIDYPLRWGCTDYLGCVCCRFLASFGPLTLPRPKQYSVPREHF